MKRVLALLVVACALMTVALAVNRPAAAPPPPDPRVAQLEKVAARLKKDVVDWALRVQALEAAKMQTNADVAILEGRVKTLQIQMARIEAVVPVQAIRDRAKGAKP